MSVWTDEITEFARKAAVKDGWPATKVAAEIGLRFGVSLTRNAVIGKMHRMGVKFKSQPKIASNGKRKRSVWLAPGPARPEVKQAKHASSLAIAEAHRARAERHAGAEPAPVDPPMTILDVNDGECRWIHGDTDGDYRMCGHEVRKGSRYCAHHHARAYDGIPRQKQERGAACKNSL